MNALSSVFLWLIPLALLPVIIHLLNRLRYQTVRWAAMMFLRSADRDASRRAKIRQWLILASRCLMLLMVLLALSRLQSRGRLARFFDPGSNLVIILFDRSASMEQLRGGVSGRERAVAMLNQGMSGLGTGSRVLWMDSATGETIPVPNRIDPERLPMAGATATYTDVGAMMRAALQEIARAEVSKAEIWIPTDRQTTAWLPNGANPPDWTDWAGMNTSVTLRVLDVAQVQADTGNRSLQLAGDPVMEGDGLVVTLRLLRESESPESVPVQVEFGGLSIREELMVEGRRFTWEQRLSVEPGQGRIHGYFSIPADSNPADNEVAVSWEDLGAVRAKVEAGTPYSNQVFTAALLPREGQREVVKAMAGLTADISLWIRQRGREMTEDEQAWVEAGGVMVQVPALNEMQGSGEGEAGVGVLSWEEQTGVLATELRDPLRMDLVRVYRTAEVESEAPDTRVLARLEGEEPLLTRRRSGQGAIYELATLPEPEISNLDAGFVLVPMMQRLLAEGAKGGRMSGTRRLKDVKIADSSEWESLDGDDKVAGLSTGRFRRGEQVLALNRSEQEDQADRLSISELEEWARPLNLQVFEDRSEGRTDSDSRVEFTSLLALLGLGFLVVESWLLTRNVRMKPVAISAWKAPA
ncbi:MAG: BatA domain-containing protein [Kiritimatiellia bacterium]